MADPKISCKGDLSFRVVVCYSVACVDGWKEGKRVTGLGIRGNFVFREFVEE